MNFTAISDTTWESDCHCYKVRAFDSCGGVSIRPGYHALVDSITNLDTGASFWNFAGKRGPYWSKAAAERACVRHLNAWKRMLKVMQTPRAGRTDRIRELDATARTGKGYKRQRLLVWPPRWVLNRMKMKAKQRLFSKPQRRRAA